MSSSFAATPFRRSARYKLPKLSPQRIQTLYAELLKGGLAPGTVRQLQRDPPSGPSAGGAVERHPEEYCRRSGATQAAAGGDENTDTRGVTATPDRGRRRPFRGTLCPGPHDRNEAGRTLGPSLAKRRPRARHRPRPGFAPADQRRLRDRGAKDQEFQATANPDRRSEDGAAQSPRRPGCGAVARRSGLGRPEPRHSRTSLADHSKGLTSFGAASTRYSRGQGCRISGSTT